MQQSVSWKAIMTHSCFNQTSFFLMLTLTDENYSCQFNLSCQNQYQGISHEKPRSKTESPVYCNCRQTVHLQKEHSNLLSAPSFGVVFIPDSLLADKRLLCIWKEEVGHKNTLYTSVLDMIQWSFGQYGHPQYINYDSRMPMRKRPFLSYIFLYGNVQIDESVRTMQSLYCYYYCYCYCSILYYNSEDAFVDVDWWVCANNT